MTVRRSYRAIPRATRRCRYTRYSGAGRSKRAIALARPAAARAAVWAPRGWRATSASNERRCAVRGPQADQAASATWPHATIRNRAARRGVCGRYGESGRARTTQSRASRSGGMRRPDRAIRPGGNTPGWRRSSSMSLATRRPRRIIWRIVEPPWRVRDDHLAVKADRPERGDAQPEIAILAMGGRKAGGEPAHRRERRPPVGDVAGPVVAGRRRLHAVLVERIPWSRAHDALDGEVIGVGVKPAGGARDPVAIDDDIVVREEDHVGARGSHARVARLARPDSRRSDDADLRRGRGRRDGRWQRAVVDDDHVERRRAVLICERAQARRELRGAITRRDDDARGQGHRRHRMLGGVMPVAGARSGSEAGERAARCLRRDF